MAHFAELDENNLVINVIVVSDSELLDENGVEQEHRGIAFLTNLLGHNRWKQTSYNAKIRKNYAARGCTYDESRDAFIPPRPEYLSWIIDEETCLWTAPVPKPKNDPGYVHIWDETTISWKRVPGNFEK